MKHSLLFWILAFLITALSAFYQRITGPTYPISGMVVINGKKIAYSLERTEEGTTNHRVQIKTDDPSISGYVEWKRYKTKDTLTRVDMSYGNGVLTAEIPNQPPAGKLQYRVYLQDSQHIIALPERESVIIRYKGVVPTLILIFHVVIIFVAMLLSARTGIEVFAAEPNYTVLTYWTIGLLLIGGLILGPIVQKHAFNAYWTGWPLGTDLTDNKIAVAFISWIIAAIALKKSSKPKWWILASAIITLIIFLIPHSLLGSELDYSKMN
jgi:hypothetical protein